MKYIANSPLFSGEIIFTYDNDGFLSSVEVQATLNEKQWHWLSKDFPVTLTTLKLLTLSTSLQITEAQDDLTFGAFWEAYKNKVGDKKKAEKLWNLLPEADRIAALFSIPKYLFWLATKQNMEQLHATTFLNQRRWENDYTVKR